jgi:hypothetical protein
LLRPRILHEQDMGWKKFCCVPRCPRHDPADVKSTDIFHKLPSNPEARSKWVELLGIPEENAFVHYRNVVCSLHFEAEKFHSPICLLLRDVYNQTNTCTRACSAIPKGVLPIRFCPQDVIQRSSCSSTTASTVSTSQPSVNTANYASSSALNDFIRVVPGKG